ncbi:hypothetical protein [Paraburkholderia sp. J8-2]|uniref:hypothetical protein n=1 Tax=Paraburkholderia sp. J8-2 TaxID=2805440 RepID=UPI002AB6FA6C|nr:hypothetical protein [Paraburkholderia sp. J8-2]
MSLSSHMAFALNGAGQVVAAHDLPRVGPAIFRCANCGGEVSLYRPDNSHAYFRHARGSACEQGALHALRAAALQTLVESRFVHAPPLSRSGSGRVKRHMIEAWGAEASTCTRVDGVGVDFYAETLAGPLIIQIAMRALYDPNSRLAIRALGYAALEISIPRPGVVLCVGDLREVVLHGLTNKIWLWHPAIGNRERQPLAQRRMAETALLFGEAKKAPSRLSMPVVISPWADVGTIATGVPYRQLPVSERIREIEQQLGEACEDWPDAVNIDVAGKDSFGVDPRLWQADVFGRFVFHRGQGVNAPDFSSLAVVRWLSMRYASTPGFERAEAVAIDEYLRALVTRGYLMGLPEQHFRALPQPIPQGLETLRWRPDARLSVSGLRVSSEQVRLDIPVTQVQRILEYFEDGHPAAPVRAFVEDLMVRLHAPERTVVALLREAGLVDG